MYAYALARREGHSVDWITQGDDVARPTLVEEERIPFTGAEYENGLTLPVEVYPLFENARRASEGWSISDHRERLGRLWANFARVAATNEYAWLRDAPDATTITTPTPTNRMVAFPYTKLLVANLPVDMGASYIMTSYERARGLGVANDKMVFPQCGADANDHWFVSSDRTSAIRQPCAHFGHRSKLLASRPATLVISISTVVSRPWSKRRATCWALTRSTRHECRR